MHEHRGARRRLNKVGVVGAAGSPGGGAGSWQGERALSGESRGELVGRSAPPKAQTRPLPAQRAPAERRVMFKVATQFPVSVSVRATCQEDTERDLKK